MSQLASLKAAATRTDVATLLQTSLQGLTSILYMLPIANRYTVFEIPKKGGGTRTIKAPDEKLKLLQQKLIRCPSGLPRRNQNREEHQAHAGAWIQAEVLNRLERRGTPSSAVGVQP